MKRLITFLGIITAVSFFTFVLNGQVKQLPQIPAKTYTVTLTLEQWQAIMNSMDYAKNTLKISDLKSKDVTYLNDSLFTPIQNVFIQQIQSQIAIETQKKDSTNKKK